MKDQIQRFIFENSDIRGELVCLGTSFQDVISKHEYPVPVAKYLGEFLCAAALLSQTIKFDGTLILQARSEGKIPLMMAEANSNGHLRAIARDADSNTENDFQAAFKNGQLSITIDPVNGKAFQGIVPLTGANLSECLEHYFEQSEQLSTQIILACDGEVASGMLLQQLPVAIIEDEAERDEQWQTVTHLASTLKDDELLSLDFETVLNRLYHQETLRLFAPSRLSFKCTCSEQRTIEVIRNLGREEAEKIIEEQGEIEIQCEFCHHAYHFDIQSLITIFDVRVH